MASNNIPFLDDPIADRQLSVVGEPDKIVRVTIGRPHPDPRGDWICPVHVQGLGDAQQQAGFGVDAVQALLNAFEAVRYMLDESGLALTWVGGESGDPGFPKLVPSLFGLAFARKLEAQIAHEVEGFAAAAEKQSAAANKRP
jgi:hypothetical protein